MPRELFRMFVPFGAGREVIFPALMYLLEDLLGDFGRQHTIGSLVLHDKVQLFIGKVDSGTDEEVPHHVQGSIIQILTGKHCFIYHLPAGIVPINPMLFNNLHLDPRFLIPSSVSAG